MPAYKPVYKSKRISAKKMPSPQQANLKTAAEKKAVEDKSHKERVAMRQMLRDSGTIPINAPNQIADQWLYVHGYYFHAGHQPPKDRVAKLRRYLGRRLKRR